MIILGQEHRFGMVPGGDRGRLMRVTGFIVALAGLGVLAGCDGDVSFGDHAYDQRVEESAERVEILVDEGFTDPSTLPTSGSAQYNGTAFIEVEEEDPYTLAGDLELNVGFADEGSVSGTIEDLVDEEDDRYSGEIVLTGVTIDRDATGTTNLDPNFGLELGGNIETPDGTDYEVDESSIALGDFYGDDYVFGGLAGELCTKTDDCVEFGGTFDGER